MFNKDLATFASFGYLFSLFFHQVSGLVSLFMVFSIKYCSNSTRLVIKSSFSGPRSLSRAVSFFTFELVQNLQMLQLVPLHHHDKKVWHLWNCSIFVLITSLSNDWINLNLGSTSGASIIGSFVSSWSRLHLLVISSATTLLNWNIAGRRDGSSASLSLSGSFVRLSTKPSKTGTVVERDEFSS